MPFEIVAKPAKTKAMRVSRDASGRVYGLLPHGHRPFLFAKARPVSIDHLEANQTEAVAAAQPDRMLPDHVCEPLNVHALLPTRQFVPAKVRVFLDALDAHAYARPPALADL